MENTTSLKRKNQQGVTLVELAIVAIVLAILAGVGIYTTSNNSHGRRG
ncbi:MAG: prepilin-type N-terminal cleavage/methylation domain-containing protein [Gammaproteobacteria bacterium WSBS_2016_MAG_OTU1]